MDELSGEMHEDEIPLDIKLARLPSCILVSLIAIPVDVSLITLVALWKSPYMLFRGWKRLFEDLIGREGPFLETVCVPFAGLTILLWPLAEDSLRMGLAYIVAAVSLFDEYGNDLLYLTEGSCFPRPQYHRNIKSQDGLEKIKSLDSKNEREASHTSKLFSQGSRTLKQAIQQYTPVQVWDWLFKSCEDNGKRLIREGLINGKDIQEIMVKGDCKKIAIKLLAWSILQCLFISAKSDSSGLILSEQVELTRLNLPRDKMLEWFISPLFTIKEQIKGLQLEQGEEACLKKLVIACKNERPEDWDETGFPSTDKVRRAQLQAIIRRLQGIVGSMSRLPTFRRRFRNLVKVLYVEAIETSLPVERVAGAPRSGAKGRLFFGRGGRKDGDDLEQSSIDDGVMV